LEIWLEKSSSKWYPVAFFPRCGKTAVRSFKDFWKKLVATAVAISRPEYMRQSQLLAGLLVLLITLDLGYFLFSLYSGYYTNPLDLSASLTALFFLSLAYYLNRTGRFAIAAIITIGSMSVLVVLLTFLASGQSYDLAFLAFLILPLLFSSAFFARRVILILGGIFQVATFVVAVFIYGANPYYVISGPVVLILLESGIIYWVARHREVLEADRRQELQSLALFPDEDPSPVMRISPDGRLLYANMASRPLLEDWQRRSQPGLPQDMLRAAADALQAGSVRNLEVECADRTFSFVIAPVMNRTYVNLYGQDITERKKLEEQFRYDAYHDSLTGLCNRFLLLDRLNHVNERKKRCPDLRYALFFLDLDNFKIVNDSLGHHAGDQLLIETARRLEGGLRSTDTIAHYTRKDTLARIAGDEFVILLEDFKADDDIQQVAVRIGHLLGAPYNISGYEVNLTASIGMAVPDRAYANPEDILRDADIAMYQAKKTQGTQVVCFKPEMAREKKARMEMEIDLRLAIERGEFVVHYQPIVRLCDNRIAGFEALVRWNSPRRGLLMPGQFLPLAEETGLMAPIDFFVLDQACRQVQRWQKTLSDGSDLIASVNLASRQIMSSDLAGQVCAILERTGYDPKKLWLEITETSLVQLSAPVWAQLNTLREIGIRIEIDDFGTGYSSLSYLQNLPMDGFKIDRSFIHAIQGGGQQIVTTLVGLGHQLGLTVVAEGVETQTHREFLKEAACDYIQGYLIAKPMSAAAAEEFMKSGGAETPPTSG